MWETSGLSFNRWAEPQTLLELDTFVVWHTNTARATANQTGARMQAEKHRFAPRLVGQGALPPRVANVTRIILFIFTLTYQVPSRVAMVKKSMRLTLTLSFDGMEAMVCSNACSTLMDTMT